MMFWNPPAAFMSLPRQEMINYDKIEKEIIPYLRTDAIKNS
jgi:hypothetical protein